tara:strand:+ start:13332 stop:13538 length:207 start_codon:yes stop_codon:yes gene_type:complete
LSSRFLLVEGVTGALGRLGRGSARAHQEEGRAAEDNVREEENEMVRVEETQMAVKVRHVLTQRSGALG